jgi:hypothetical protein
MKNIERATRNKIKQSKIFIVPVTYEMQGVLEIEASNPKEAKEIASRMVNAHYPTLPSGKIIKGSAKVKDPKTFRNFIILNGKQKNEKHWGEYKEYRL